MLIRTGRTARLPTRLSVTGRSTRVSRYVYKYIYHTKYKYKYKYLQGDASRPNSIYNLSGPPTDLEASRPQSALTSYSNFHPAQQRRVVPTSSNSGPPRGGPLPQGVTSLTQESLMNVSLILIRILFNTLYFFPLDALPGVSQPSFFFA